MALQKYRADVSKTQSDNAVVWWRTGWVGGTSLVKIDNCRLANLAGDMRATVYVTGEADTWYSIPAKCRLMGKVLNGYITSEDGDLVFRHCYC